LKIALAVAGTMAVEGSITTWVAQHRRHHAASDREGDPHSPIRYGTGFFPQMRGLIFAHIGWFFIPNPSHPERWCPDILADPDLVTISNLSSFLTVVTFALPFGLGYAVTGTFTGAMYALLWAGVVRVFVLHHVTWGVNSVAHTFGSRPFKTKDNSRNVAILAILSFGDSWHNAHHAFPTLARHGVDRHQLDSSAGLIRLFEKLGWATSARWPSMDRLDIRRRVAPAVDADLAPANQ
jgi:stearoyl-CoA desaturase (delta-9 desaturase)